MHFLELIIKIHVAIWKLPIYGVNPVPEATTQLKKPPGHRSRAG